MKSITTGKAHSSISIGIDNNNTNLTLINNVNIGTGNNNNAAYIAKCGTELNECMAKYGQYFSGCSKAEGYSYSETDIL